MDKRNPRPNNRKLIIILLCGIIFMFGFCYMLVPLYNLVCKQEGLNGKGALTATAIDPSMKIDKSRTIKVTFSTTVHGNLHFTFKPLQHSIEIHPGETKLVYFFAANQTGTGKTVQAIPSITPTDAAKYLKKTECFCFTQQYFFNKEKADMPVYFFIEPGISKDVTEVTLSYTLFDASEFVKKQTHFTKGRIDV